MAGLVQTIAEDLLRERDKPEGRQYEGREGQLWLDGKTGKNATLPTTTCFLVSHSSLHINNNKCVAFTMCTFGVGGLRSGKK